MSAPTYGIHPLAVVGQPPQHRAYRAPDRFGGEADPFTKRVAVATSEHTRVEVYPLIAKSALLEAFSSVDSGVERATRIGERVWLMKTAHVGHDAVIGDDCELCPGVVICGHAELGNGVRVGVNASVLPFVKVGAGARIGAGAVVTKNVPAGEVWAGNPARRLKGSCDGGCGALVAAEYCQPCELELLHEAQTR